MADFSKIKAPQDATGVIVLSDGSVLWGKGLGAETDTTGEICFNTSMTGYQEIMTDPSYAEQIITFTFPHIGNTGTNEEDIETVKPVSRGLIIREDITHPSNWRANAHLNDWLTAYNLPGVCNIDTRALTRKIRDEGAPHGVICHNEKGEFDLNALYEKAREWPGLKGMDLTRDVTGQNTGEWTESEWELSKGYQTQNEPRFHVVAIDYGAKRNILRRLAAAGCKITVVPCTVSAEDILAYNPDGIFLSNGPGDPAATAEHAVPVIQKLVESGKPLFGICLGHQLLALALGGKTGKMHLGHRGANHPVQDLETGKVEITSQNHGFEVLADSLPETVEVTHISLFDKTNEGIKLKNKPVFSVQYHPEASPGPEDSHYLFDRFVSLMEKSA